MANQGQSKSQHSQSLNIFQQLAELFKGKDRWLYVWVFFVLTIIYGLMVWTFIEFLEAEDMMSKLNWMFYTLISFITVGLIKQWIWNQMDKNEIKRYIRSR